MWNVSECVGIWRKLISNGDGLPVFMSSNNDGSLPKQNISPNIENKKWNQQSTSINVKITCSRPKVIWLLNLTSFIESTKTSPRCFLSFRSIPVEWMKNKIYLDVTNIAMCNIYHKSLVNVQIFMKNVSWKSWQMIQF